MSKTPFVRTREVFLGDPSDEHVQATPVLQHKHAFELWPLDRLHRYVDMLREFGFNSLQVSELAENYACSGYSVTPEAYGEKLHALCEYAASKGMTRTLFVWGSGPVDLEGYRGRLKDKQWWRKQNACPCVPGGAEALLEHYRYQARHAPWVDHVVTHWGDPGGCHGERCTVSTALELHNQIAAEFRKQSPQLRSTFSLWLMHHRGFGGRWRGYESVETVLQAGILDPEVGLALSGRFNLKEARRIAQSGRPVGVWAWYLADDEIAPSLHVHTGHLGRYFNSLPEEAASLLDWHSIDSNCHGLNVPGLYVAGQLMIDPRRDADRLLQEFCGRAFGNAADGFLEGLRGVAQTRCRSDYLRLIRFLTGEPRDGMPDEEEDPEEHLAVIRRARRVVERLVPDASFSPDLPLIMEPSAFLEDLRANLQAIEQYARFRIALRDAKHQAGRVEVSRLPAVAAPGEVLAQYEYRLYQEHLRWLSAQGTVL